MSSLENQKISESFTLLGKTVENWVPDELPSSRGKNPDPEGLPEVDDEVEGAQNRP